VLGNYDDYEKAKNYWKYLSAKFKKGKSEVGSATTQMKLKSPDGKMCLSNLLRRRIKMSSKIKAIIH